MAGVEERSEGKTPKSGGVREVYKLQTNLVHRPQQLEAFLGRLTLTQSEVMRRATTLIGWMGGKKSWHCPKTANQPQLQSMAPRQVMRVPASIATTQPLMLPQSILSFLLFANSIRLFAWKVWLLELPSAKSTGHEMERMSGPTKCTKCGKLCADKTAVRQVPNRQGIFSLFFISWETIERQEKQRETKLTQTLVLSSQHRRCHNKKYACEDPKCRRNKPAICFSTTRDLKRHQRTHRGTHSEAKKLCPYCKAELDGRPDNYKRHLDRLHKGGIAKAAWDGDNETVVNLLSINADLANEKDRQNRSPLHLAMRKRHFRTKKDSAGKWGRRRAQGLGYPRRLAITALGGRRMLRL